MSLGTISISEGDGDKVLATSSVVQGATTVELQRNLNEDWALGAPATYLASVSPTAPTSAGVVAAIENTGASDKNIYLAKLEIIQSGMASAAANVTIRLGRGSANGTGGSTATPKGSDPDAGTPGIRIRTSSSATPNTGITAPTTTSILAQQVLELSAALPTRGSVVFDLAGQLPVVPFGSTEPLTIAVSGTTSTAGLIINLVLIEHEV